MNICTPTFTEDILITYLSQNLLMELRVIKNRKYRIFSHVGKVVKLIQFMLINLPAGRVKCYMFYMLALHQKKKKKAKTLTDLAREGSQA